MLPARPIRRFAAALLFALAMPAAGSAAQESARPSPQAFDTLSRTSGAAPRVPLFQHGDWRRLGIMAAMTAATMPFDRTLAREFARPGLQQNQRVNSAVARLTKIHERSLLGASLVAYAGGRLVRSRPVADIGLHTAEAIAAGTVIGSFLKSTAGRARPRAADGDPFDFRFAKGYTSGDYRAFPSLHEIGSFAAAAALTSELHRLDSRAGRIAGIVTYGTAGAVGLSRMYSAEHWASDVILGSAIGIALGRRIVSHNHGNEDNQTDRFLLGARPSSGGMNVTLFHRQF